MPMAYSKTKEKTSKKNGDTETPEKHFQAKEQQTKEHYKLQEKTAIRALKATKEPGAPRLRTLKPQGNKQAEKYNQISDGRHPKPGNPNTLHRNNGNINSKVGIKVGAPLPRPLLSCPDVEQQAPKHKEGTKQAAPVTLQTEVVLQQPLPAKETTLCGSDDLSIQSRALRHSDTQILIITDGAAGSHVWNAGGDSFHQPAFTASPLIDTTGCGDVYHGAFLHHWLETRDLRAASAFASELAAKNAEGLGGRFALQRADDTPK